MITTNLVASRIDFYAISGQSEQTETNLPNFVPEEYGKAYATLTKGLLNQKFSTAHIFTPRYFEDILRNFRHPELLDLPFAVVYSMPEFLDIAQSYDKQGHLKMKEVLNYRTGVSMDSYVMSLFSRSWVNLKVISAVNFKTYDKECVPNLIGQLMQANTELIQYTQPTSKYGSQTNHIALTGGTDLIARPECNIYSIPFSYNQATNWIESAS